MKAEKLSQELGELKDVSCLEDRKPSKTPARLSEQIYGFQWNQHFPVTDQEGQLSYSHSTHDECSLFIQKNFSELSESESYPQKKIEDGRVEQKMRYYRLCGDFFQITKADVLAGVLIGTPIDWSSYYIRAVSIAYEYRGQGIYQRFMDSFLSVLRRVGVQRVEIDIAPSNLGHLHALNKLQFNINGQIASERWGTMVHLVKHLNPSNEELFINRFCVGVAPQLSKHQNES